MGNVQQEVLKCHQLLYSATVRKIVYFSQNINSLLYTTDFLKFNDYTTVSVFYAINGIPIYLENWVQLQDEEWKAKVGDSNSSCCECYAVIKKLQ